MKQNDTNSYLVKLVYRIDNHSGNRLTDFDEQYRLVFADSEEEAMAKSRIIGVKHETEMPCDDGRIISWSFIDTTMVRKIECGIDGAELFSNTVSSEDALQYTKFVKHQAETEWRKVTAHAVHLD